MTAAERGLGSRDAGTPVESPSCDDNLDVTRLPEVTERDGKRITKYLRSLRRLTASPAHQDPYSPRA